MREETMVNFVHVVNNWNISDDAPIDPNIETQEVIPAENLVKAFLYHGGHKTYAGENCEEKAFQYTVCICYEFICPVLGCRRRWYEGYVDGSMVMTKFNSLVKSLCGTRNGNDDYAKTNQRFFRITYEKD